MKTFLKCLGPVDAKLTKKCYKVRLYVDRTWQSPRKRQLKYWKLKFYSQPWRIFPYKSTASQLICNLGLLTNTSQQHIVNTYCIWNHKCLLLSSLFIFRVSKIKFYLFCNLIWIKFEMNWVPRSSIITGCPGWWFLNQEEERVNITRTQVYKLGTCTSTQTLQKTIRF